MVRTICRPSLRVAEVLFALLLPALSCTAGGPPQLEVVSFETKDGFVLHGDLLAAKDPAAPALILLHMYRSNRGAWAPLVPKLAAAGFNVLAVDQRAHGESRRQGEKTVRVEDLSRPRFTELVRQGPKDVAAARRFLRARGLGRDRVALVGASYGCTVALLSANAEKPAAALVLLSPGTSYFGVDVLGAARGFPGPLLTVAAEDDTRSTESARRIAAEHEDPDEVEIYPNGGHGTRLLTTRPEVMERVVGFLRQALE